MRLSNHLSALFLSLYKQVNRTGLLDFAWGQSIFIASYFAYKKYLEDANANLVKKHPEFFRFGHILDIGANIGYTSYVFSKVLSSPYQIFAFEPEERNIRILKKVAKAYGFLDNIILTPAAVGDKIAEIDLWRNDNHHADHRVLTDDFRKHLKQSVPTQKTTLITIDSFLEKQYANQPITFIKIDVQGYELAVCKGMQQTLLANPNCIIELEYCPTMMEAFGYQPQELIEFFQCKNYLFYTFNKQGELSFLSGDFFNFNDKKKNCSPYFDILCSKRQLTSH